MFTGIVQTKGTIVSTIDKQGLRRLVVSIPANYLEHLDIGASIAVNGVCLTVTKYEITQKDVVGQVYFDVIDETLKLTNLAQLQQQDKVNIERSVTFGTEIGGHIVSGHIHTQAIIEQIIHNQANCSISLTIDPQWIKYILHKGFIAIDGISLTVGQVSEHSFTIHLIPETLAVTNLGSRQIGDYINIEIDQNTLTIVQTIERYLEKMPLSQSI